MHRHLIHQHLAFTHQLLRGGRIIPKARIFDAGVEFFHTMRRGLVIHPLRQQGERFFDLGHDVLRLGAHG